MAFHVLRYDAEVTRKNIIPIVNVIAPELQVFVKQAVIQLQHSIVHQHGDRALFYAHQFFEQLYPVSAETAQTLFKRGFDYRDRAIELHLHEQSHRLLVVKLIWHSTHPYSGKDGQAIADVLAAQIAETLVVPVLYTKPAMFYHTKVIESQYNRDTATFTVTWQLLAIH